MTVTAGAYIDAVDIQTAPQNRKAGIFSKIIVNIGQDFFFIAAKITPAFSGEGICPFGKSRTVAQSGQIEADVQRAVVIAAPVKRSLGHAEPLTAVTAHNSLIHGVGDRLVGQNLIIHRIHHAQTQNSHVDDDLGFALDLSFLNALAGEYNGLFTLIAVLVFSVNIECVLVFIALCRVGREQPVTFTSTRSVKAKFAIQPDLQLGIAAGSTDGTDPVAIVILRPCVHMQGELSLIGQDIAIPQIGVNDHSIGALMLIWDGDGKGIEIAAVLRGDLEGVFTGLTSVQQQSGLPLRRQRFGTATARLIQQDFGNPGTLCVTHKCHGIRQQILLKPAVVDRLCRAALFVFTSNGIFGRSSIFGD